jgi:glutamate synthase (ferredoxin)
VAAEPHMMQVFIGRNPALKDDMAFERKLYIIRKLAEREIRYGGKISGGNWFYVSSLSCRTVIYKGMLMPEQVGKYFADLRDPGMATALALVHSRFSTNTFPSWDRAHPYRYVAHNGEINTLRGNINWMHAGQASFVSELFGTDIKKVLPVINTDGSDSAMFDNCLELLVMSGRELPHAMMMMIPEPWENHESMSPEKHAFYEYQNRRVPRPQRSPPVAVLRHQGRYGHYGVGSRRVAGGAGAHFAKRPVAAGPDVSRGYRVGPHRRGRGIKK